MVEWFNIHVLLKYTIAITVNDTYEDYLKEMNINILDSLNLKTLWKMEHLPIRSKFVHFPPSSHFSSATED